MCLITHSLYALQLKAKGFVYVMKYYHMIALVYIVKYLFFLPTGR